MKFLIYILIIINIFIRQTKSVLTWQSNTDMKTGYIRILNYNYLLTNQTSIINPLTFNFTYSSLLATSIKHAAVGYYGFDFLPTNSFSPSLKIRTFTNINLQIIFTVKGDTTLNMVQVNYISIGSGINFFQIQYNCFLCNILNTGNGSRTQYVYGQTIFNQSLTQFKITTFSAPNIKAQVYLNAFQMYNSEGVNNHLEANVKTFSMSSSLEYTFKTSDYNIISNICYYTIIFYEGLAMQKFINFGGIGRNTLTNTSYDLQQPGKYKAVNRMFFGVAGFNFSRGFTRYYQIHPEDPAVGSLTTFTTNFVTITHFYHTQRVIGSGQWYDAVTETNVDLAPSCSPNTHTSIDGQYCYYCQYSCLSTCNSPRPNSCQSCISQNHRVLTATNQCICQAGYVDLGQPLCYPCDSFIPGCYQCISQTVCNSCKAGFSPNGNGSCQCNVGYLVSGFCTSIIGCMSAIQTNLIINCISCNITANFKTIPVNTKLCQCDTGYYLTNTFSTNYVCLSKCGDSVFINSTQNCDDGNQLNNDGCSSLCQIQTNWTCTNISLEKSLCTRLQSTILQLAYIFRNIQKNEIQIGLNITNFSNSEYYQILSIAKFKPYLTHNIPGLQNYSVSYDSSTKLVILKIQYLQTLEGSTFNLSLNLDPNYFTILNLSSMTIQINTIGMNSQLTYDTNPSINQILNYVFIIISIISLILSLLSVISQKMIGIQLIQTIQSVLFILPIIGAIPNQLSSISNLKFSNGYNLYASNDHSRVYSFNNQQQQYTSSLNYNYVSITSIGIEKQFLISCNISFIVLLAIISLLIFSKTFVKYYRFRLQRQLNSEQNGKELQQEQFKQYRKSYYNFRKFFNFLFQRIFFLIGFALMFLILQAISLQLSGYIPLYYIFSTQLNQIASILGIFIVTLLLAFVLINGIFPKSKIFPFFMIKRYYPCYYFIYQTIFIILAAVLFEYTWALYILTALTITNIIVLIILRPYPEKIHNFGIIFNQSTIFYFELVCIMKNILTDTALNIQIKFFTLETIYLISVFVLIALLVAVNIFSLIRLLFWRSFINGDKKLAKYQLFQKSCFLDDEEFHKKIDNMYGTSQQDLKQKISLKNLKNPFDLHIQTTGRERLLDISMMKKQIETVIDQSDNFNINESQFIKQKPNKNKQNPVQINWMFNKLVDDKNQQKLEDDQNKKKNIKTFQVNNNSSHEAQQQEDQDDILKQIKKRLRKNLNQKLKNNYQEDQQIEYPQDL